MSDSTILYTLTDEAPALATYSLLPIVTAFARQANVTVATSDISLAGRIVAAFPDYVDESQRISDDLAALGEVVNEPSANIIKTPNISASIPQIKAAVAELQAQGYALPAVPDDPQTDEERDVLARYKKVSGSAVNPVLRQGNSDRRAPLSVKKYAQRHPHTMGAWSAQSKTRVAHMPSGDFRSNEVSHTFAHDASLRVELVSGGEARALRAPLKVLAGEIVDATKMDVSALRTFFTEQKAEAAASGVLFSLHLKATMMKVSDPIMFGHAVTTFLPDTFATYGAELRDAGLNPNDGLAAIFSGLSGLANGDAIAASIASEIAAGPRLAMVDSSKGITNLHAPNDVIVDASMPAMIRTSGHMWGPDGEEDDTLAVIPDASYAGIYQVVIDDCKAHGAFDPSTMGSVPNVGLMAQAAEEYGSHDKTFEITDDGVVLVTDEVSGDVVFEIAVSAGDIFRMCQTKDVAVRDWVKLAVQRARLTGDPAIFWLDETRAHDAQLIVKVADYLKEHDTAGLDISILSPEAAIARSLQRIRQGLNTISVTGNVLRDYLTDLFPIMELGTSAKMLSIVPLIKGGGLFETGAGGSAPKHVQQFEKENYLRWDSLGEFLALASSFEHLARVTSNSRAQVLADTLDRATGRFLEEDRSPGRKLGTIDNRGSHFYLAQYWAQELARQSDDAELAARFASVAQALTEGEERIVAELLAVQGSGVDLGGYFHPDQERASSAMRPSATLNAAIALLD